MVTIEYRLTDQDRQRVIEAQEADREYIPTPDCEFNYFRDVIETIAVRAGMPRGGKVTYARPDRIVYCF